MLKNVAIVLLLLFPLLAIAELESQYEVATITSVKPHDGSSAAPTYDVTLRTKNLQLVVLATPRAGNDTVKYVSGRQVLIKVGEKTVTYHDLLGQEFVVPVLSRTKLATTTAD